MRELFILIAHLLVTLAKLGTRGGLRAVAAESLAVKHQLLIMKRAQRRAPNLTSWDRLVLGVCALLVSPKRLSKMAVIVSLPACCAFTTLWCSASIACSIARESDATPDPKVRPEN